MVPREYLLVFHWYVQSYDSMDVICPLCILTGGDSDKIGRAQPSVVKVALATFPY